MNRVKKAGLAFVFFQLISACAGQRHSTDTINVEVVEAHVVEPFLKRSEIQTAAALEFPQSSKVRDLVAKFRDLENGAFLQAAWKLEGFDEFVSQPIFLRENRKQRVTIADADRHCNKLDHATWGCSAGGVSGLGITMYFEDSDVLQATEDVAKCPKKDCSVIELVLAPNVKALPNSSQQWLELAGRIRLTYQTKDKRIVETEERDADAGIRVRRTFEFVSSIERPSLPQLCTKQPATVILAMGKPGEPLQELPKEKCKY